MITFKVSYKKSVWDSQNWSHKTVNKFDAQFEASTWAELKEKAINHALLTEHKIYSIEAPGYHIIDFDEACEFYDEEFCIEHGRNWLDSPDMGLVDDWMEEDGYEIDRDLQVYYKKLKKA